jgi:hypothetical protein
MDYKIAWDLLANRRVKDSEDGHRIFKESQALVFIKSKDVVLGTGTTQASVDSTW